MLDIKAQDSLIPTLPPVSGGESHSSSEDQADSTVKGTSRIYAGMWGLPEIFAVCLGGAAVLAAGFVFMALVMPARTALESVRSQKTQLEQQVLTAREKYGRITSTTEQVSRLVASADAFENAYLPPGTVGQTALYQRVNSLIAAHDLVNTSGPEYVPLPVTETGNSSNAGTDTGRERFRSIFPGVYVTMTVDGAYRDIRRFISDIETGGQFVIISSVGIEPAEQKRRREEGGGNAAASEGDMPAVAENAAPASPSATGSKPRGDRVSLKIEMAAYFRRPSADGDR